MSRKLKMANSCEVRAKMQISHIEQICESSKGSESSERMENNKNWELLSDGTAWFYNGEYHESFSKVDKIGLVHNIYRRYIPGTRSYQIVKLLFSGDLKELTHEKNKITMITLCESFVNIENIGKILLIPSEKGLKEVYYEHSNRAYCRLCVGTSLHYRCECQSSVKRN